MTEPGTITFVPSVHFSPTHRRRVRDTIRDVDPDLVAVELDEQRYERIQQKTPRNHLDLAQDLPPVTAATVNLVKAIQQSVVRLYGLDPETTDMETAVETASELEIDVALIDDPIEETFAALGDRVGLDTLPKFLVRTQFMSPQEQARQLQVLTLPFRKVESGDDVQPMVDQIRQLLPEVTEVLIDRRDEAMAQRLHALRQQGHDLVVVIGAGHHNGIRQRLDELESQDAPGDSNVPIRSPASDVTTIPVN